MRRRIARFVFVVLLGTLAGVLGVVTALVLSPPGRDLLARSVSSELSRALNGSVQVESLSGSFLYDKTIEGVVVRDTTGARHTGARATVAPRGWLYVIPLTSNVRH